MRIKVAQKIFITIWVDIGVAHRNSSFALEDSLKLMLNKSDYNFDDYTFQQTILNTNSVLFESRFYLIIIHLHSLRLIVFQIWLMKDALVKYRFYEARLVIHKISFSQNISFLECPNVLSWEKNILRLHEFGIHDRPLKCQITKIVIARIWYTFQRDFSCKNKVAKSDK